MAGVRWSRRLLGALALGAGLAGAAAAGPPASVPADPAYPAGGAALIGQSTVVGAQGAPGPVAAVRPDAALPAWAPVVAADLGLTVRTCRVWRGRTTPTRVADCAGWDSGGPLNLVVVGPPGTDPRAAVERARGWRPAAGRWLVAEAQAIAGPAGCAPGWAGSGDQLEQRLDPITRHHFKLVTTTCGHTAVGAVTVVMGEAHTDLYDARTCHGDRSIAWDTARDRMVAALRAQGGVHVVYVRVGAPGTAFPSGCGQPVKSDGQVAYVVLDPPSPARRA